MPLIKCPDCGREISDKAKSCIHCGCPIEKSDSHVTVYGIRQNALLFATIKLYVDNQLVAKIPRGEKYELSITKECTLMAKCGINPSKAKYNVKPGIPVKLQIVYDRLSGSFRFEEIDLATSIYNF